MTTRKEMKEIKWNIVNSALAGALVLLGSMTSGEFTTRGVCVAFLSAILVAVIKFKSYWEKEEDEYKCKPVKVFAFMG